jgi:hypothetical protein
MGAPGGADQFVKLELHRHCVAVPGVLDQEHHQEGDSGGAGVDHQLPGARIAEKRAGDQPDRNHGQSQKEGGGPTGQMGDPAAARV